MKVAEVRGLKWRYKGREERALNGVDLEIERGEILGIMGPSGAGKTTLCLALMGIIPQRVPGEIEGEVRVLGMDTREVDASHIARRVGIVFEDPESQFVMSSVEDEMVLGLEPLGLPREEMRERVLWALELVGLGKEFLSRHPLELSGGEKQRVAIAAMLAREPEILILDEPTSDLDPVGKEEVMEAIKDVYRELGLTMVLVEHEAEVLAEVADRIAIMDRGEVVLEGDPRTVFSRVEELVGMGVHPPQVTLLFHKLGAEAVPITLAEAVVALKKRVREIRARTREKRRERGSGFVVECVNVVYEYRRGPRALRGVNLCISRGEFAALVGPNGSGKTTLAKVMAGLLEATGGEVLVDGRPISSYDRLELSSKVGYVFQNPDHQLFCQSVREEIAFGLRLRKLPEDEIEERVQEVMERLGLSGLADEHPFFLSKGERRRLALASILVLEPALVIVDEPTTGQDRGFCYEILSLLDDLRKSGASVLVITHSIPQVVEFADRLIVMKDGTVIADGEPADVLSDKKVVEEAKLVRPQVMELAEELGAPEGCLPATIADALSLLAACDAL